MSWIGGATTTTRRSARSSVSAFGTSSPSTSDRYVTTAKAIAKPSQGDMPSPSKSRTSGSPTAPVRMARAVIPTWTVEMARTGSSMSRSAVLAPGCPASARSASGPRRAVTTLYSPITKKAFAPTRASTMTMVQGPSMPRCIAASPSMADDEQQPTGSADGCPRLDRDRGHRLGAPDGAVLSALLPVRTRRESGFRS